MNRLALLLSCVMFVAFPVAAAEEKPTAVEQMNDINYSYGYQLGRELLAAGVELRPETLYQALYDAMDKTDPELSKDEMTILLEILKEEVQ